MQDAVWSPEAAEPEWTPERGACPSCGMAYKGRVLVVDDDADVRCGVMEVLRVEGYEVDTASDGFRAVAKLSELEPDLLLTDLKMPGMDGIELMQRARKLDPERPILVMTAFAGVDTAVSAMRLGALDYVPKPIDVPSLLRTVQQAIEQRVRRRQLERCRARADGSGELLGTSAEMLRIHELVERVGPSHASVLITGESGTGKELVAAALHRASPRAAGPLVRLHCAALAETLLESELFGHEKGAFTGALARHHGRFQQAHGGTLFLDEIGELSASVQVKLLRFLQERQFERVGGNETVTVDVRVVAATNRDLKREVAEHRFREDLFYRLNVVSIELPPLRERQSDVLPLASRFLERFAHKNGCAVPRLSDDALQVLTTHTWPGNVRELENAIEHAVVVCRGDRIETEDLPATVHLARSDERPLVPGSTIAEVERYMILRTLEHTGGCKAKAARMLGISERKIQYKLHEYSASAERH